VFKQGNSKPAVAGNNQAAEAPNEATKAKRRKKMKNYFFPGIDPEKKGKLQEAAIAYCDMEVDGLSGIVVDEDTLSDALAVFEAVVTAERITSFEGIVRLELAWPQVAATGAPRFGVTVTDWNGNNQGGFMKIAEQVLVPAVQTDVILSVPHGKTVAPVNDGKFHIWIWSAPAGQKSNKPPKKIWGIAVDCRDDGFLPSGQGVPIMDAESDWAVAELVGGNLYVHHDLCHEGTDRELAIFRRLCEEVAAEITLSSEEKAKHSKRLAKERKKKSRDNYVKECSARIEKTVAGTKEKITTGELKIRELQESLTKTIREVNGAQRKLEQMTLCHGDELKKYGEEYDKLISLTKISRVEVVSGVIKVFTDTLYCIDPRTNKPHDIGAFRIEIYTNGANNGVRWFNLTRQVVAYDSKKMHAPHVFPEGKACLGNTEEIFPELIANYEFAAVAMVAIQFIETVNVEDAAGKYINCWPLAPT
jgi:hypothetical protein